DDAQLAAALVRRCVAGDAEAWEELVRQSHRRIYNICYRFTNSADDAEDLSQEVFIKVYRTLTSYDASKGAFGTWLTTMTRNLLVDHFRRSKLERMSDSLDTPASEDPDAQPLSAQLADAGPAPDQKVLGRERQEMVQAALQKL